MGDKNYRDNDEGADQLAQVLTKHMDSRFDVFEKRMDDRFNAQEKRLDGRFGFWQEYMDDRFSVLQENLGLMIDRKLQPIADRLKSVEQDVKVIKAVITDQSSQLNNHEKHITALEQ